MERNIHKRTTGEGIIAGLRDAVAHASGKNNLTKVSTIQVPNDVNVQAIRERLGLSQKEFALRFGFTIGAVRNWEQGRRHPEGPARILLKVIDYDPTVVNRALACG